MSKYRGPRLRLVRRLGTLPGLTSKIPRKQKSPGEHGQLQKEITKNLSAYGLRLFEKQKLRYNYGINERQLVRYVKQAKKDPGPTGELLLRFLEMRLDNIVYRLGMAPTIAAARQLVSHGHILVNQQKVNISSYGCSVDDVISVKNKKTSQQLVKNNLQQGHDLPAYLSFDKESLSGVIQNQITRSGVGLNINELLVIEYYSRN